MMDYRNFKNSTVLIHSAKGSEWTKHKYVKKIDGVYYYPVGYTKGRTVDSASAKKAEKKGSSGTEKDKDKKGKLSKKEVKKLASAVISGKYGVGADRQKALGKKYNRVQHRVNVMLLGKDAAIRIRDRKRAARAATKTTSKKK